MPFDAQNHLDKHGGDALKAILEIQSDRVRATRSKNELLAALGMAELETEEALSRINKLAPQLQAYAKLGTPEEVAAKVKAHNELAQALEFLGDSSKFPDALKDLPKRLKTGDDALLKLQARERSDSITKALTDLSYSADAAQALEVFLSQANAELSTEKVQVDGKEALIGKVKQGKDSSSLEDWLSADPVRALLVPKLTQESTPPPAPPTPKVGIPSQRGGKPQPVSVQQISESLKETGGYNM